jgi:hypothetical protein
MRASAPPVNIDRMPPIPGCRFVHKPAAGLTDARNGIYVPMRYTMRPSANRMRWRSSWLAAGRSNWCSRPFALLLMPLVRAYLADAGRLIQPARRVR